MYTGLSLTGIGIIFYIVHVILYNRLLIKYHPELFENSLWSRHSDKRSKKATFFVTSGKRPAWIVLFFILAISFILFGIVITIVALIMKLFQ